MALVETGLTGLAHMLVAEGLIEKDKVKEAVERAKEEKVGLIDWLVTAGWVKGAEAVKAQGVNFGAPYFDVASINPVVNASKFFN